MRTLILSSWRVEICRLVREGLNNITQERSNPRDGMMEALLGEERIWRRVVGKEDDEAEEVVGDDRFFEQDLKMRHT